MYTLPLLPLASLIDFKLTRSGYDSSLPKRQELTSGVWNKNLEFYTWRFELTQHYVGTGT